MTSGANVMTNRIWFIFIFVFLLEIIWWWWLPSLHGRSVAYSPPLVYWFFRSSILLIGCFCLWASPQILKSRNEHILHRFQFCRTLSSCPKCSERNDSPQDLSSFFNSFFGGLVKSKWQPARVFLGGLPRSVESIWPFNLSYLFAPRKLTNRTLTEQAKSNGFFYQPQDLSAFFNSFFFFTFLLTGASNSLLTEFISHSLSTTYGCAPAPRP